MSKLFYHIVFLIPVFLNAQIDFINRSLSDSSLKIVYSGVENIIEIKGFAFTKTTRIGISNSEIIPLDKNKIKIIPKYGSQECMISVENLHTDSEEFKQVFSIDTLIGALVIRLAGVKDSVASIHQLLANPFLISEIPKSYYKSPVYITSFTTTFIGEKFDSVRTNATGNLFTQEQIYIIKQLRQHDKILFQDVYFFWPDGRRRKYTAFVIAIK